MTIGIVWPRISLNTEQIEQALNDAKQAFLDTMAELEEMCENFMKAMRFSIYGEECSGDTDERVEGVPPKKYGMSLRRSSLVTPIHYNYIPRTARNLPYQRRAY